jgi:hypothetical protein
MKTKKLIYRYCEVNYNDSNEMFERISHWIKMYDLKIDTTQGVMYRHDFFGDLDEIVVIDIVPVFLKPITFEFELEGEKDSLLNEIKTVIAEHCSNPNIFQTVVIDLIHTIHPHEFSQIS